MGGIARDTLYLACTRPAMRRGVPAEGYWANIGCCTFLGMILNTPGLTESAFALTVPIHFLLRWQANRNPNFFREWRVWFRTRAASIGGTLWAMPHRPERGWKARSHV